MKCIFVETKQAKAMKKAPKAPKQVKPILANIHPDEVTAYRIEVQAAELYPTGCHVLFGRDQAYVMPTDWGAGSGYVLPYAGDKRPVTFADVDRMKTDRPDPDPFGWLRSN